MLQVPHVTASGNPLHSWSVVEPFIAVSVRLPGSPRFYAQIDTCSADHPRPGAFPIKRRDQERWIIFGYTFVLRHGRWTTRRERYDRRWDYDEDILLTNTPEAVSLWLAER